MEQIKARINAALEFLQPPYVYQSVEAGLLQLRLALETLVLSSLVSNRKAVQSVAAAFTRKKHDEAFHLAKQLNPAFWPVPCEQVMGENGGLTQMRPVTSGYLTQEEYLPTWGRLSAWLHATNPFQEMPEPAEGAAYGMDVARKLIVLLDHHYLSLLERGESMVCMMNESSSGRVFVTGFEPAAAEG